MDDDGKVKKQQPPPLPTTTTKKKKKLLALPSFSRWMHLLKGEAAVFKVPSLVGALLFACLYGGQAAYNLRNDSQVPPPTPPLPAWVVQTYVVRGADAVAAADSLERGQAWCSEFQAAAAALALLLLAVRGGGAGRLHLLRALALAALAASAANHWMHLRTIGLLRIASPGNVMLAFDTAGVFLGAAVNLLGFLAFLLLGDE